ncbi:MAG: phosphatase [Fusobacteriaceae bacterium]|nr:phosphatase [Fusobacteriaceae bacterium]
MTYKIDLHMHTNSTPHAYSTLEENIARAIEKKMEVIAITNHGPALPDSPHWWNLKNMAVIPRTVENLNILRGVEANIVDEAGNIDLNNSIYKVMDIIMAGFHRVENYKDIDNQGKNTNVLINLMKMQYVDIITHPGNPQYPIDIEKIVSIAKEYNIALEINNASFYLTRRGSAPNCEEIVRLCKKNGNIISLGSDAHISYEIGNFSYVEEILEKYDFPKDKILNSSKEILFKFLKERKMQKPTIFSHKH